MKRHDYDEIFDKNKMLQVRHDYETPMFDRQNERSRIWHEENKEKANARQRSIKRKPKFEKNPKWHKSYGGATYVHFV